MDIYEKKYKEALERTRKLKENPQSVFNEYSPKEGDTICDYIFPELKELGDEKIRKWIIDDIRYNMNNEPLNNSEYKKKEDMPHCGIPSLGVIYLCGMANYRIISSGRADGASP